MGAKVNINQLHMSDWSTERNPLRPCCLTRMFFSFDSNHLFSTFTFSSLHLLPSNYSRIQHPPLLALHFHSPPFLSSLSFQSVFLPLHVSQLKLYGSFTPLFLCKDNEQAPLCDFVAARRSVSLNLGASRGPKDSDVPSVAASVVPLLLSSDLWGTALT